MKSKMRIGLLIDSLTIPFWAYRMLEKIQEGTYASINLLVVNENFRDVDIDFWQKGNSYSSILWKLYDKIDRSIYKCHPNAFIQKNLSDIIQAPLIRVEPAQYEKYDEFKEDDISNIKEHQIDVFIKLGFGILYGDIFSCTRYGIWSYRFGEDKMQKNNPSSVWEVLLNTYETGTYLVILNENSKKEKVIAQSHSSTDYLSVNRSINRQYWKAALMAPRKLRELNELGDIEFKNNIKHNYHSVSTTEKHKSEPSNRDFVFKFSIKILNRFFRKISQIYSFRQWILLYNISDNTKYSYSFDKFRKMIPPKDKEWADPFPIFRNDKYYIFLEEVNRSINKGHISVIEMDKDGNYSDPRKVLEKDHHLSYPFLIEDNGELFMIPETSKCKQIELYKCLDFPLKWELEKVIMKNVSAVDTTILKHDNIYWLFTTIAEDYGSTSHDELSVFWSYKLNTDQWIPHPLNPVVSDVKRARPAGRLFSIDGKLIRPSQNCAKHYGYGMNRCEIVKLDKKQYKEKVIQKINPDWNKNIVSTHTMNYAGGLSIIDAQLIRRK